MLPSWYMDVAFGEISHGWLTVITPEATEVTMRVWPSPEPSMIDMELPITAVAGRVEIKSVREVGAEVEAEPRTDPEL
jgi:hypothetical protein